MDILVFLSDESPHTYHLLVLDARLVTLLHEGEDRRHGVGWELREETGRQQTAHPFPDDHLSSKSEVEEGGLSEGSPSDRDPGPDLDLEEPEIVRLLAEKEEEQWYRESWALSCGCRRFRQLPKGGQAADEEASSLPQRGLSRQQWQWEPLQR